MDMKPLGQVEQDIIEQFRELYHNLHSDDITKEFVQELQQLHEEIQHVTIEQPDEEDEEICIEFQLRNADYIHLYLERDEDGDCWGVIA